MHLTRKCNCIKSERISAPVNILALYPPKKTYNLPKIIRRPDSLSLIRSLRNGSQKARIERIACELSDLKESIISLDNDKTAIVCSAVYFYI